jgi:hypothetical protein
MPEGKKYHATDGVSLWPHGYFRRKVMQVTAYIHSLKDKENDRHVLGEAAILEKIGDNLYLAEYNGVKCTAIFNPFVGRYFVDDVYGVVKDTP